MVRIAIFASGSGTNAENIITHFASSTVARVTKVFCNRSEAYVLNRAKNHDIPSEVINNQMLSDQTFFKQLESTDIIILAGFLAKIPENLIYLFPDKIINIHPSLLPNYGGKGMYGAHVHNAVIKNQEIESGISIHLVNEKYDEGRILFQACCELTPQDDADSLALKIHQLEQKYFPKIVEDYINDSLI